MASPTKTKRRVKDPATETLSSPEPRLAAYRAKRRFDVTPEPSPNARDADEAGKTVTESRSSQVARGGGKKTSRVAARAPEEPAQFPAQAVAPALAFVVQKHDARRLHYDVRLEVDGAMVSWAVPKGPSFDPTVRRLAVQTEDHPMEYNAFEGRIPEGEYGAGDVLIWDRGTYETVPPGQARAMLDKGHLHVRLFGQKLIGEWHFVRTNGRGGDDGAGNAGKAQWLMFKAKDRLANPAFDVIAERPESVVSGRVATRGPRQSRRATLGHGRHNCGRPERVALRGQVRWVPPLRLQSRRRATPLHAPRQ